MSTNVYPMEVYSISYYHTETHTPLTAPSALYYRHDDAMRTAVETCARHGGSIYYELGMDVLYGHGDMLALLRLHPDSRLI